jgi:hypothetical protein
MYGSGVYKKLLREDCCDLEVNASSRLNAEFAMQSIE